MWASYRGVAGARRLLELDLEHEPSAGAVREEVFDRLGALAACAGRRDPGTQSDQRRLQVSARDLAARSRAEVATKRRLGTDLAVRDRAMTPVARGSGAPSSSATGVIAPIVSEEPSRRIPATLAFHSAS